MQILPAVTTAPQSLQRRERYSDDESLADDLVKENMLVAAGSLGPAAYFLASASYPGPWLHEQGHAMAINALFDGGAPPTVSVTPFGGGLTQANPTSLSPLGEALGLDTSRAVVAAAGTVVDMGIAAGAFGLGFKLRHEHPIAGATLMGFAATTVFSRLGYAATALMGDTARLAAQGNDFANLAVRGGVPPWLSFTLMAAMLPLQYATMKWMEGASEAP